MRGIHSEHDKERLERPAGSRRRTAWLFVAWLTFWLTTVASPFEHAFAHAADHHAATAAPASEMMPSHGDHHGPAPSEYHCPDVSAVTVNTIFVATFDSDKFDGIFQARDLIIVAEQSYRELRSLKPYHPPPSADIPLYLRIQRLLI